MSSHPPANSGYTFVQVGDHVTHPLYPELGIGVVQTVGEAANPGTRTGRVQWADGHTTRPCLGILRIAPPEPANSTWTTPCVIDGIACTRPGCRC